MLGSTFGTTLYTPNKPQSQSSSDILLSNAMQFSPTTKYLDLSPELKSILDDLEKKLYTNGQEADTLFNSPATAQLSSKINDCIQQTQILQASTKLTSVSFTLTQFAANHLQQSSTEQFKVAEMGNHTLTKLKANQSFETFQYRFIDDYIDKLVSSFEQRISVLSGHLAKFEKFLKQPTGVKKEDSAVEDELKTVINNHYNLIFKLAERFVHVQQFVLQESDRLQQLKKKYLQIQGIAVGFRRDESGKIPEGISGNDPSKQQLAMSQMSPFKPFPLSSTPTSTSSSSFIPTTAQSFTSNSAPFSSGISSNFTNPSLSFNTPSSTSSLPSFNPPSSNISSQPNFSFAAPSSQPNFSLASSSSQLGSFAIPQQTSNAFGTGQPTFPIPSSTSNLNTPSNPGQPNTPFSFSSQPSTSSFPSSFSGWK